MPGEKDVFVNQAYLTVVESAANTLTFNKLLTGTSIYEKVGWIISRIDYFFSVDSTNFGADNDAFDFGISVTDQITSVGMEYSGVLDWNRVKRVDLGTAGTGFMQRFPISKSFADLQGGGILVPPNPLFIFGKGIALTSAITLYARMFYTVKMLKVEDYWELVELRRMVGV